MSQPELVARVAAVLEALSVPWMLTGSLVSSIQGEPRSTHDIDLVVALPASAIPVIAAAFPEPDYYLDPESAAEAIREQGMFNLIDVVNGDKVDFWLLTDAPFDQSRFSRREKKQVFGATVYVPRPEDTILAKLQWAKMAGGSEKQLGDVRRVYEIQYGKLDHSYLNRWAAELGVTELLDRIRAEADPV